MSTTQALELAIKAIDEAHDQVTELCGVHNMPYPSASLVRYTQAIEACKQALEQQSEPVAWANENFSGVVTAKHKEYLVEFHPNHELDKTIPLYTTPKPLKRLSDEDKIKIINTLYGSLATHQEILLANTIMDKMEEINK